MEIVLIRHGERDYSKVYERNYIGFGLELAPLTENGVKQAENAANDPQLNNAQLIVSSPYTRALQTAAIISRIRNIPLTIEMDLHEWYVDNEFQNKPGDGKIVMEEFKELHGKYPEGETRRWESIDQIAERVIKTLQNYLQYKKIIMVTHAMVMHQLIVNEHFINCQVETINFDQNFISPGWVDLNKKNKEE